MLLYAPLERYRARYTELLSKPVTGWMERNWREVDLVYSRLQDDVLGPTGEPDRMRMGFVLDARKRFGQCSSQIEHLLKLIEDELVDDDDVIYFEDFWTPGIEQVFYALDLKGLHPKMFAFCWAQSCDRYDFTARMGKWIKNFEAGIATGLTGIFFAHPLLRDIFSCEYGHRDKLHVVGLPFDSRDVFGRMPTGPSHEWKREDQVVFSSRWDTEKNPDFFLEVANNYWKRGAAVKFIVCTGHDEIRSNNPELLKDLRIAEKSGIVRVYRGLTKEEYYHHLAHSKIQFNCADQDWVSFTLLESGVAGCYPVYPNYRSFPDTFLHHKEFMYDHKSAPAACDMIDRVLEGNYWTQSEIFARSWIYFRFNFTWLRMLKAMGIDDGLRISTWHSEANMDPFEDNPMRNLIYNRQGV